MGSVANRLKGDDHVGILSRKGFMMHSFLVSSGLNFGVEHFECFERYEVRTWLESGLDFRVCVVPYSLDSGSRLLLLLLPHYSGA